MCGGGGCQTTGVVSSAGHCPRPVGDARDGYGYVRYATRWRTFQRDAESERFQNPVFSGFLYSFGAKQVSKIMKMNDFRIRF